MIQIWRASKPNLASGLAVKNGIWLDGAFPIANFGDSQIFVKYRSQYTFPGTLCKNQESGIWLKICKIIAIPETEILHS
jgi:hypothetical protein